MMRALLRLREKLLKAFWASFLWAINHDKLTESSEQSWQPPEITSFGPRVQ